MPSKILDFDVAQDILIHWSLPKDWPGTTTKPKSSRAFLQKSTDEIFAFGSCGNA